MEIIHTYIPWIPYVVKVKILWKTRRENSEYTKYKYITLITEMLLGPGSSVGIANDYGLDVPGSNLGGNEIFRPSRPSLGPTQPPVKWVPGLSRG